METYTKNSPIMAINQDQTKLLSLLSTPFEIQIKHQLSWIALKGIPLNVVVQEAYMVE